MKTQILDAARYRFEQFGLSKVTMDEIARDIGMAKASLYYYFPTKENLFQAVLAREHETFLRSIVDMHKQSFSASDKMKRYVRLRFEYFSRMINLQVLESQFSTKFKPVIRALFVEFAGREIKLLTSIVRQGKASGEFCVASPEAVARAVLHIMQGLRLRAIRETTTTQIERRYYEALQKEFELIAEIFIRGLCSPDRKKKEFVHRLN